MQIPKNNEKNARKLANATVEFWGENELEEFATIYRPEPDVPPREFWDRNTLVEFAAEVLTERYIRDPEKFKTDWENSEDDGSNWD